LGSASNGSSEGTEVSAALVIPAKGELMALGPPVAD